MTILPVALGWWEWADLPELGLLKIKAKLDTGTKTSVLGVADIEYLVDGDHPSARFRVVDDWPGGPKRVCVARLVDERIVRDSGGHRQHRFVIRTPLRLAGMAWPIELTLTSRSGMKFPLLLGRSALSGRVLVDPGTAPRGSG